MSKHFFKKIFKIIFNPKIFWAKTSIAYLLLMSLVPTFGILALIMSLFKISPTILIPYLNYLLPIQSVSLISEYLINTNFTLSPLVLIVTLIFSFNIVTGAVDTLTMLEDNMFGFKPDRMIRRKIKSILISLVIIGLIVLLIILSVIFPTIVNLKNYEALLFPFMWLILLFLLLFLFIYSPSQRMKFKEVFLGAIFSSLFITILLQFFQVYIKYFGNFDSFFGPLASIVVLLIMFDWMATILYYGIAINVVYKNFYQLK